MSLPQSRRKNINLLQSSKNKRLSEPNFIILRQIKNILVYLKVGAVTSIKCIAVQQFNLWFIRGSCGLVYPLLVLRTAPRSDFQFVIHPHSSKSKNIWAIFIMSFLKTLCGSLSLLKIYCYRIYFYCHIFCFCCVLGNNFLFSLPF